MHLLYLSLDLILREIYYVPFQDQVISCYFQKQKKKKNWTQLDKNAHFTADNFACKQTVWTIKHARVMQFAFKIFHHSRREEWHGWPMGKGTWLFSSFQITKIHIWIRKRGKKLRVKCMIRAWFVLGACWHGCNKLVVLWMGKLEQWSFNVFFLKMHIVSWKNKIQN